MFNKVLGDGVSMALIPGYTIIYSRDFPQSSQSIIDQLALTLNPAFTTLFSALTNNLTLTQNFLATIKDVTLTVDANGNPTTASSFNISNSNTITGLQILKATNNTSSTTYPTSAPFISYTQAGNLININNVTGLQANQSYTLRVVAYLN